MIKFGTGGFRGIIGEEFTIDNVKKITHAISNYIDINDLQKTVIVSYDLRDLSKEAALAAAEVLSSYNIKVYLSNTATPSPVAMYMTMFKKVDIGIMITASHNPPNYNGLKIFEMGGSDASYETTNQIEELIIKKYNNKTSKKELIIETDFLTPYINYVNQFISLKNNDYKIMFDFIYGTGSKTIVPLLTKTVFKELKYVRTERDERYLKTLPNPNKWNLIANEGYQNYDLVIGLDQDADRIGIIDDLGNYVDNNEILSLIYYYLITYKKMDGPIVKNITTSNLVDETAKYLNKKCFVSDVGFKNVTTKMLETDALIGGESSGGLTIRNYIRGKDATLAALIVLEMVINYNKPLSELIKELREKTNFHRTIIEKEVFYKNREKLTEFLTSENLKVDSEVIEKEILNNNIKYHLEADQWVLVRFSGTEPLIRVMAETDSIEKSHFIINNIMKQVEGI